MRIFLIQGSPRSAHAEPGKDSKTRKIVEYMVKNAPEGVELDVFDLAVEGDKIVRPEKANYSTSKFHAHWPDSQYGPNSKDPNIADRMHDEKVFERLELADGIMLVTPVHWWAVPSQVKTFFDRLISCNGTLRVEEAKRLFKGDIHNPKKTAYIEQSNKLDHMLNNHLQGKTIAFFVHGDDGADDYENEPLPPSAKEWESDLSQPPEDAVLPIVWQMAYSGIYAPKKLIRGVTIGAGKSYSQNDEEFRNNIEVREQAVKLLEDLVKEAMNEGSNERFKIIVKAIK